MIQMPVYVICDPIRLSQVLTNLLGNAIKFTRHGEVELQVTLLSQTDTQTHISFAVKDTGIGIPEEKLLHIFEKFTQADSSTTREFGGTGLGLSISKQLIELMGGQISVESEPGKGSVFSFTLALQTGEAEDALQHDEANLNPTSGTVLLVEDNEINRLVSSKLLKKRGLKVVCAHNGQEAIALFTNNSFDIVFMDMQMPVMGGLEATREIRQQHPEIQTPIIAMTANAMEEHKEQCLLAGMNDFISKPVKENLLQDILNKYLASSKRMDETPIS